MSLSGPSDTAAAGRDGAVGAWRNAFLRAPYGRDAMVRMSVIVETFETACTWDRFPELHAAVMAEVERCLAEICGGGWVTCRFTHVYPDGAAPYFSVIAPGRPGSRDRAVGRDQGGGVRRAASPTAPPSPTTTPSVATTTLGIDSSDPTASARSLAAAKDTLDPTGILNPGVITT